MNILASIFMSRKVYCPTCKKLLLYEGNPYRPFCSQRCKKRDLGAWASEEYVIQGKSSEVEEKNVSTSEETAEEILPKPILH